jgi:hypothetical protein
MLKPARKCLLSTDGFSCALLASFAENDATLACRIVDVGVSSTLADRRSSVRRRNHHA